MGRVGPPAIALALLLLSPVGAAAALLENGALRDGSGSQPTGWRLEAWNRDATRFGWQTGEQRGELSVTNFEPNDARWCQTVAITPGSTYRISAEVKTEGVGDAAAGAFISLEPRIGHSHLLRGTNDWQPIVLSMKATGSERQWDVCLRLGSYGSLNTGKAWFRNVAMVLVRARTLASQGPSVLTRLRRWTRQAGWAGPLVPIAAGVLLAFGLGLFDRRRPPGP